MNRIPFLFILAILLCFSTCQVVEQDPSLIPPDPALEDSESCVTAIRNFELVYTEIEGSDSSSYEIEIETGFYTVEPCMCRVIGYKLEVASGTASDWELRPKDQNSIYVSP